jgi:hypothetical protein
MENGQLENVNSGMESEKMVPQSQVDKMAYAIKMQTAEKVRQEMQAEFQQAQQGQQSQGNPNMQGMGGMQGFDQAAMERNIRDSILKAQEEERAQMQIQHQQSVMKDVARKFNEGMSRGPELFEDFKEVTSTFEPHLFPETVYLASEMENSPEIIYELSKNPSKLAQIQILAEKSPVMAQEMLKRLSASIAENRQAKDSHVTTNAPLSRMQSSSKVGADNGKMTLSDLKKSMKLRG